MITLDYKNKESLAGGIAGYWDSWDSARDTACALWAEIDTYIHATETSSLEGGNNFDHKTALPLTSELYEQLIAVVYSTAFPHEDWLGWKGFDTNAVANKTKEKVLSYIRQCHMLSDFSLEMRKVIDDFVRYGNCFVQVNYKNDTQKSEEGIQTGYIGPAVSRISPFDIVFNPTCTSFTKAPKIVRKLISTGELYEMLKSLPEEEQEADDVEKERLLARRSGGASSRTETNKETQYIPAGFGSIQEYYKSGIVELLCFYGDIYDADEQELHKNRCVIVADRDTVILNKEELYPNIFKGSWSPRPDNLWSQGPLDKVVGINYMINHRENGKNDAIDKFIYPDRAYTGDVEEIYDEVTGHTKYILPEGGSVQDIRPDSTVLTFDNQIMMHRELARQSAQLPQQLAGFRTAGEKTATEVQSLHDGAFRGFINKVAHLEEDLIERVVKAEIRIAKDNYSSVIRILKEDKDGVFLPIEVTEEDLSANGKLVPIGSRRFARQLQNLQGLNTLANSNVAQLIGQHINTFNLSKAFEHLYGFSDFGFIKKLAVIDEQQEAQTKQMMADQASILESSEPTAMEMQMEVGNEESI